MADVPIGSWRWHSGAPRFWRGLVGAAVVLAGAALAGWWHAIEPDLVGPASIGWTGASLLVIGTALTLLAGRPVELRLDAAGWQLAEDGGAMRPVRLDVALDLGFALLLCARPEAGRQRWLPVDRRALGSLWPALRRAVYSPRPAGGPAAAVDLPNPKE